MIRFKKVLIGLGVIAVLAGGDLVLNAYFIQSVQERPRQTGGDRP